jgi:hypothetical protein
MLDGGQSAAVPPLWTASRSPDMQHLFNADVLLLGLAPQAGDDPALAMQACWEASAAAAAASMAVESDCGGTGHLLPGTPQNSAGGGSNGGGGAAGQQVQAQRRGRSGPKSRLSPFIGVSQYKRTGRWEAHLWLSTPLYMQGDEGSADEGSGSDSGGGTAAALGRRCEGKRGARGGRGVAGGGAGKRKKSAKGRQLHLGSFLTAVQAARCAGLRGRPRAVPICVEQAPAQHMHCMACPTAWS